MKFSKLFLLFITIIGNFYIAYSQEALDLKSKNLLGKVKSIKIFYYNASEKFGELQKGKLNCKYYQVFNSQGYLIKETCSDEEVKIEYAYKFFYDIKNNLIKGLTLQNKIILENKYDSENRLIQTDNLVGYIYPNFRTKNKFSFDGKIKESNAYNFEGLLQIKIISKYDDKGKEIESSVYDENGKMSLHYFSDYNEKGNLIKVSSLKGFEENGGDARIFKYNDKNQVTQENFTTEDGTRYTRQTYSYNEYGNIVSENSVSDDTLSTYNLNYEYKYDTLGNWIEQKMTGYGEMARPEIIQRQINYYLIPTARIHK